MDEKVFQDSTHLKILFVRTGNISSCTRKLIYSQPRHTIWFHISSQHWFRWWLGAWWHQAITCTNADFSQMNPSGTNIKYFSINIWRITNKKVSNSKFCCWWTQTFPGFNELNLFFPVCRWLEEAKPWSHYDIHLWALRITGCLPAATTSRETSLWLVALCEGNPLPSDTCCIAYRVQSAEGVASQYYGCLLPAGQAPYYHTDTRSTYEEQRHISCPLALW